MAASLAELVEGFRSAVHTVSTQASADGVFDASALEASIRSSFDELIAGIERLFAAPEAASDASGDEPADGGERSGELTRVSPAGLGQAGVEAIEAPDSAGIVLPVGEPVVSVHEPLDPVSPEPEPVEPALDPSLDAVLADLRSLFNEALAGMVQSLGEAARLADPSPPTGNGAAYARFLAEYDRLRGLRSGVDLLT